MSAGWGSEGYSLGAWASWLQDRVTEQKILMIVMVMIMVMISVMMMNRVMVMMVVMMMVMAMLVGAWAGWLDRVTMQRLSMRRLHGCPGVQVSNMPLAEHLTSNYAP